MDYNALTQQIRQYANRTDVFFTEQIPSFIENGISRIYSEAKNIGFEIVVDGNIPINTNLVDKPVNWRDTISLEVTSLGKSKILLPRSYEFCRAYWPDATHQAEPEFYANFGNDHYYIVPNSSKEYSYRLLYLGLPVFNIDHPTNFLTVRYPRLLLYACMLEAMPYLKDDERLATFEGLYSKALADINADTSSRYSDRTGNRGKS